MHLIPVARSQYHYPKMASLLKKWEQALRCCRKYLSVTEFTKAIEVHTDNDGVCRHRLALYVACYLTVTTSNSAAVPDVWQALLYKCLLLLCTLLLWQLIVPA